MFRAALLFCLAVGFARADAPRFDHYLLALSLAPAFCEDRPEVKQRLDQCRTLTTRPAPTLTLHGLWPNNARGRHPEYCDGKPRGRFCALDDVRLPPELRARLAYAMPGEADCLDRHEWEKHGSCSGLPEAAYFEWSIRLAARVERALGDTLRRHQGREIALATLTAALARADPALAAATSFDCRVPRTPERAKRRAMLTEVRVRFDVAARGVPGRPLPLENPGRRNSGCPGGRAWVDTPDD